MKKIKLPILFNSLITILILTITTLLGLGMRELNLHDSNIVVLYIFSVLLISILTKGYVFGLISSVISILLFNWFFTNPYYNFKVDDPTYLITFAIMAMTSILTSTLTSKVKQSAQEAREKEKESNSLYQMINHLTDAEDVDNIGEITVKTARDVLNCNTAFIHFDESTNPMRTYIQCKEDGTVIRRELTNLAELKQRMNQLHGTVDIDSNYYLYPIYGKNSILAALRIPAEVGETLTASQTRMLHSILENTTLALDRFRSLQAQMKSHEETTQERYRANLLRSISHDIRTPLSGIIGTSEMLMSKISKSDETCYKLANDIYKDAEWLHGLVENILNLTKLNDGKMKLEKKYEAIEEVIGAALMVIEKRTPNREIDITMPENVLMVPMDARLISQVLVNLLDNAIKHTHENDMIEIIVESDDKNAIITVADQGVGIPVNDLPLIFQMFYTTGSKSPDAKRGVGLGLAICQSIVEAHGGTISARNREERGAAFTFILPLGGDKNEK